MRSFNSYPLLVRILSVWIAVMGPYILVLLMNEGYFPQIKAFFEGPYAWVALIPGGLYALRWVLTRRR